MKTLIFAAALVTVPVICHAAAAPPDGATIEIWTRPPGGPADAAQAPRDSVAVAAFTEQWFDRVDPQYGRRYTFRGFPLQALIDRARNAAGCDLALLHFGNGMVIPLAFRDAALMRRLNPYVALGVLRDGKPARLPPVTRKAREYVDIPFIQFAGNKVVVAEAFHPDVAPAAQPAFTPWRHADSLVGIELVAAAAYYRQFQVGTTEAARTGYALFRQNCQFCHGAREVGAAFGWDFVKPMPVSRHRNETRLYYHIAYRRLDAPERNLMMPALKHMTESDARNLWQWLETIGKEPMPPYTPAPVAQASKPR
jgi:mono/diheme cytochrome c family protein